MSLNNGVGRFYLGRVEDGHEGGWTSGGPCICINRETRCRSYVVVMVSIVAVVAVVAVSLPCVRSCIMCSGPAIARGAPFILLVIDRATIDRSSIDMVEGLISDAWWTELGRRWFSLFTFLFRGGLILVRAVLGSMLTIPVRVRMTISVSFLWRSSFTVVVAFELG